MSGRGTEKKVRSKVQNKGSNLNGKEVHLRVGKVRGGSESSTGGSE